jgi:hypothetical protein
MWLISRQEAGFGSYNTKKSDFDSIFMFALTDSVSGMIILYPDIGAFLYHRGPE